ncbi:MAG: RdgB/HAM1 family non-canonical purine NTP pyrophosphatase [Clostridiales bacterium]|jgi:XTP/dITP diphosphohydrolase|nr:RdgB/HAM1 family non-canonical purine NTP pyrophosphatase [Clostridiales bacterium]
MTIIFATSNKGKLREAREILTECEVLAGAGVEVIEDGETFMENAVKKAVEFARELGKPVIADDSGLEVDFLNKEPGVRSARWLGEGTPYEVKNAEILRLLAGVEGEGRSARFVCAAAYAEPGGRVITAEASAEGVIHDRIAGGGGFGYDPIFYVPGRGRTTAEMSPEEKNKISHRGKALRELAGKLRAAGVFS